MRTRLLFAPLCALALAALACSALGKAAPTPAPTAIPGGSTAAAATLPPEQTAAPGEATPTAASPAGANLSNSGTASSALRLAFDGAGTLHLLWLDKSARQGGDYFHRQKAAGGEWSKAESLTSDFEQLYGDVSLLNDSGGHLCVIFTAALTGSDASTIGLYQRCQAGDSWGAANKLAVTQQTGVSLRGYVPARGADGSLHAVFIGGAGTIYFDDVALNTDSNSYGPSLAIDKAGGYHAAWLTLGTANSPGTLQYRFSADQGKTWQDAQTLSTDNDAPIGGLAHLLADSAGNVHLLWGDGNIYYRRWTPGSGWGEAVALAGDQSGPNPALAADAQGLARVVWERSDGLPFVAQAADGKWSAPRPVSELASAQPQIAVDSAGTPHVAWLSNNDVYYAARPDLR